MLDLKEIINNTKYVKERLGSRGFDLAKIDELVTLGKKRSELMINLQAFEAKRNKLTTEIAIKKTNNENIEDILKEVSAIKSQIELIKSEEEIIQKDVATKLLYIPNLPNDNVPNGKDENDNVVIAEFPSLGRGKINNVKPHYEIGVDLDILDFKRSVKISGSRFWSYKNDGARLVRAIINFMLTTHAQFGYEEYIPPLIVSRDSAKNTGQLPKFEEDLFCITKDDSFLIPTAEVPLTNLYSNEIVDLNKPIALTAYTPCFRSEAGSGGKDNKGIIRGKQFHKVELVKIVTTEQRVSEFKKTLDDAKRILELLELPFQMLQLCTGDLGFSSEETIDLEVWIPSENRYREISSVSLFGDFQGRRSSIRYKNEEGQSIYASTINGSGLAIDRLVAAILENYQNEDGSITIPKALRPYMNNQETIE